MRTDSLFYRLFQDWPGLVLEPAGLEIPAAGYALRAKEIKQTGCRLDGVLVAPDEQPDGPVVFLETQFQPDPDFDARWFSELFLYLYRRPPRRFGRRSPGRSSGRSPGRTPPHHAEPVGRNSR